MKYADSLNNLNAKKMEKMYCYVGFLLYINRKPFKEKRIESNKLNLCNLPLPDKVRVAHGDPFLLQLGELHLKVSCILHHFVGQKR